MSETDEKKTYQGKFTQNYPTEREDYPSKLTRQIKSGSVSFEQEYEMRMKVFPLKRVDPEMDTDPEETGLPPGFDGTPQAA